MITSQVPVMYQTMMMVENGAATGFMGSMETVPGFLDNITNAAQLEIKLKEITNPGGAEAYSYAKNIHLGMQKQKDDQGKKLWPVGIFYASGDMLDDTPLGEKSGYRIEREITPHPYGGSIKADSIEDLEEAGAAPPATTKALAAGSGSAPVTTKSTATSGGDIKLSDVLWKKSPQSKHQDQYDTDLDFQKKIVGDILIKKGDASPNTPTSVSEAKFEDPTESVEDKNPPPEHRGGPFKLKGFYYLRYEKKRKLWEKTYKLFGDYCQFKADNENQSRELFQKLTPASKITPQMLKDTSSRSFKWTISLIDMFFKTWIETRSQDSKEATKIVCDFRGNESPDKSMPVDYEKADAKFDNCQTDPKKCSRNRALLRLVELIAEDRVIEDYKGWHEAAMNQALGHHPWISLKVQELMCTSLRANRSGGQISLCDTTNWLEAIAEENRQVWVRFVDELSRMSQNAIGSASFRPQENSVQNGPGGNMGSSTGSGS